MRGDMMYKMKDETSNKKFLRLIKTRFIARTQL